MGLPVLQLALSNLQLAISEQQNRTVTDRVGPLEQELGYQQEFSWGG
jgi:hypothetical protein